MSSESGATPSDTRVLQLKAEQVAVTKRLVAGETVRVSTVTEFVESNVNELLAREQVDVERVSIGRIVDTAPDVREEGGVTIIPVVEEEVFIGRRLVLKEEIRISRKHFEERFVEDVVLRRQSAVVTRTQPGDHLSSTPFVEELNILEVEGPGSMENETIVAPYDTAAHAQAAVGELEAVGVSPNSITQHPKNSSMPGSSHTTAAVHEKGFWASLFGGEPDHDTAVYGHSIDNGATVVTVKVPANRYDEAATILEKHHPVDIDERSEQYGLATPSAATPTGYVGHAGMTGPADDVSPSSRSEAARGYDDTDTRASMGLGTKAEGAVGAEGDTLQLAEEFLNVGKRAVRGGTTRIRRYTVERPVEENVTLHNERVVLDRRPVTDGRVLANADFTDRTISMTETNEEAVVSKTARVVEEIGLHKEASDRVETVRDTLRKDDVEVEEIPGERLETSRVMPVDRKI